MTPPALAFALRGIRDHAGRRLSRALDRPLAPPAQVTAFVTRACAARCVMCDIWRAEPEGELDAGEWVAILGRLREWLGPFWLVLTGGEPLQKPGIFEVLAFCRERGIRTKTSCNGMLLRGPVLEQVRRHGPDFVSVSIDSPDPRVHDELRGTPGLWARAVAGLRELRKAGGPRVVGVATVVMEANYRDLPRLGRFVRDEGLDRMLLQPLMPYGRPRDDRGWHRRHPQWVRDPDALAGVLHELSRMKRAGLPLWNGEAELGLFVDYFRDPWAHPRPARCEARYNLLNIEPNGDVNFCWTVRDRVGNLRDARPEDLWRSARAAEVRETMGPCRAPCVMHAARSRTLGEQLEVFRTLRARRAL